MAAILVVEDDRRTVELLCELLIADGFAVEAVSRGDMALEQLGRRPYDLVVLDVMLPGKDGFAVCREIRGVSRVPIVMLTARGDPRDRVTGLEGGADDYLPKPFDPRELLARIHAVLRRSGPPGSVALPALKAGPLVLDPAQRTVTLDGKPIDLTTTEFDLLRVLVAQAGKVVPRDKLMELARGQEFGAFDRSIDVHVSHIRKKLGDDARAAALIKTIRGVGYQLAVAG